MVNTDGRLRGRVGGRGQLMLVGAVSIALILMGLVVVFNTVLYTDTKAATDALEDASEAQAFADQVRKETKLMMLYYDNDSGTSAPPSQSFDQVFQNWSRIQSISHAHTGPVFVSVECLSGCSGGSSSVDVQILWETEAFKYTRTITVSIPSDGDVP